MAPVLVRAIFNSVIIRAASRAVIGVPAQMKNAKRTMSKGKRHEIYSGIMHMVSQDGANNEPIIDWYVWNGPDAFTPKVDPFAETFTDDDDQTLN